mgnify:CR=1 FL=1
MARIFKNFDVTSLYPSEIEIFGYSSRSQKNKDSYIDLLHMRKKAKHGLLEESFLKQFGLTNDDLKSGLKLPLNAYSGALRAKFNKLYDNLQGFSICTTGQLLLLQLMHDLDKIPTLEFVSANTDAVAYTIEEEYQPLAQKVLNEWQEVTGLELEEDNVVKIVMRDVNNYVEIVQTGENDYSVNYKGGTFTGKHIFKWDKHSKIFKYSFDDDIKGNSMTIVSEAVLKYLLFDKKIEETINNCNDIFRFQIITHLGHTYQKMVQESPDGDIELQRNNRIYAGLKPSGKLVKVKSDGRRDSLSNSPDNPIIDNANKCTIEDVNKKWYIKIAQQRVEDFLGTGKQILKGRKKLMKKDELIEELEKANKKIEELEQNQATMTNNDSPGIRLLKKINKFREAVQEHKFIMDRAMDDKLGGGEYASIGQLYNFVQQTCLKVGLDFSFEPIEVIRFEKDLFKPSVGAPRHLSEVRCIATFTDIDTGCDKRYSIIGSGSDSIDKATSGAETLAFRNWFKFNFTPKEKFNWEDEPTDTPEISESTQPKIPTYIPPQAKQEIKEQVVATKQKESSDQEDIDIIVDAIMEIRELTNNPEYAKEQLEMLQKGEMDTSTILSVKLSVENRLNSIKTGV